jgi:hypothetical protein
LDSVEATVSGFTTSISDIRTLLDTTVEIQVVQVELNRQQGYIITNLTNTANAAFYTVRDNTNAIALLNATVSGLTTSVSNTRTLLDTTISTQVTQTEITRQQGYTIVNLTNAANAEFYKTRDNTTAITALRVDVYANTLKGSQLLTAIQYQSDSIYAIDQAIQGLNGQVGVLETTQVTHADLIREFDQNFNEPSTGVIFKIDSLTTIYNTHIDGVFLTIRQNVDDNNLILGTLSTHTTSLLTAMTQIYTRVKDLETHHP